MDILYAIILGIIEGITEFLPISSTAHLIVAEDVIGFKDTASVFTVVIQLGAIAAAAFHFRHDLMRIVRGLLTNDRQTRRFVASIAIGLLPAGIVGLIVEKFFGIPDSLLLIASALIVGGITFLIIEQTVKNRELSKTDYFAEISWQKALLIGIGQCLAIIPGVSRSGATIMTGLLAGLDRRAATIFSFYLSIPIMLAASLLKIVDDRSALGSISGGTMGLVVGTVAAFVTALLVIKWLLGYVQTNTFKPFAYYRIIAGCLLLIYLALWG